MNAHSNSATAQRKRILQFLHTKPLDTLTARKELDVMHPAARVMELRKQGIGIKTIRIDRPSDCGKMHSVACYVLEVGAVAAAPTRENVRILSNEIDKEENTTGGDL
jgi:hypothetical protein